MDVFHQFTLTILFSLLSGLALLFLTPRLLANQTLLKRVRHLDLALESGWADRLFLVLFFGFTVIFTLLAVLRYATLHTGYLEVNSSWDLGQYDQIIWNSLHGRLFQNSFVLDADSFLGKSFTPILLAFVPLYAVWSGPAVLLVVQVIGVAFTAFPLYWFARAQIGSWLAILLCASFFLSPGTESLVLIEFHEIALATPVLGLALFFLMRHHYAGLIGALAVALLIKEEIAFIVVAFGVYIFLFQRQRALGLTIALFGIVWGAALLQYIIPFFRGAEYGDTFYYFGQSLVGGGGARYSYLGNSISEIAITLLTRPDIVVSHLVIADKIEYLLYLFVPLVFLPLLGAEVGLLALPTLGYSLLSTYKPQYTFHLHYVAPVLPILFFGAATGLKRISQWVIKLRFLVNQTAQVGELAVKGSLGLLILTASGATYFFQSPGPLGGEFQIERYQLSDHAILGNQLLAQVPENATVVTQKEFLGHLSQRQQIYEVPIPDYRQSEYFIADRTMAWFDVHRGIWDQYLKSGYFQVLKDEDGYVLGKRVSPEKPLDIHFGKEMTLLGYTLSPTGTLKGGMTFRPIVFWRADAPIRAKYKITMRVSDAKGHVWAEEDREPQEGAMPTDHWEITKVIGDQYTLRLPSTMPAGDYRVMARVHPSNGDDLVVRDAQGNVQGDGAGVAMIRVEKDKSSVVASELVKQQPMVALFADMQELRFLGYYPMPDTARPGDAFQAGLYWRARSKPAGDYVVAVQLRDVKGVIALEQAARPASDSYPTLQWDEGEVLLDWHELHIPLDFQPGAYQMFVTLQDAKTRQQMGEIKVKDISVTQ